MRVLAIIGSQPRHFHVLRSLLGANLDLRVVVMQRESLIPVVPDGTSGNDSRNFSHHFATRAEIELQTFGTIESTSVLQNVEHLLVDEGELNSSRVRDFVSPGKDDVGVIFGSKIIKDPLLSMLPRDTINMHLGLSPRYRGSATLFWPFYFLEPQYCGVTFHKLIPEPDAGSILHQARTDLRQGDGIHDVGARTVVQGTSALIDLLTTRPNGWNFHPQRFSGRNFLTRDFEPHHLRVIYDLYEDHIVDSFLRGTLGTSMPRLIQA